MTLNHVAFGSVCLFVCLSVCLSVSLSVHVIFYDVRMCNGIKGVSSLIVLSRMSGEATEAARAPAEAAQAPAAVAQAPLEDFTGFVLGYTGEVGKEVVKELAAHDLSKVVLIGRRQVKYEEEPLAKFVSTPRALWV